MCKAESSTDLIAAVEVVVITEGEAKGEKGGGGREGGRGGWRRRWKRRGRERKKEGRRKGLERKEGRRRDKLGDWMPGRAISESKESGTAFSFLKGSRAIRLNRECRKKSRLQGKKMFSFGVLDLYAASGTSQCRHAEGSWRYSLELSKYRFGMHQCS